MEKEVKLKNGFTAVFNDKVLNDYRLIKEIGKMQRGEIENDIYIVVDVFERLLGKEQAEALEEFLADDEGRVDIDTMYGALEEIIDKGTDEKNR